MMDKELELPDNACLPQHPLPEEIRGMGRDDTVCQFCGVSYLILNEIKNLQLELDKYKNEVDRLKHFDEREKVLNGEVSSLNIKLTELLDNWQDEQKRNNEFEGLILQKNVYISQLKNNIENCSKDLDYSRVLNEDLKSRIKDVANIAAKVNKSTKELNIDLSECYRLYQNDLCQFMKLWNKQRIEIMESVNQLHNMYYKSEEKCQLIKHDMDSQLNMYRSRIKDAESAYENQKIIIDKCYHSINTYRSKITMHIDTFNGFKKKQEMLLDTYKKRIVCLNEKANKFRTCLKSVKDKEQQSFADSNDQYRNDITFLRDEMSRMVNAHQHQIKQLNESFREKLLKAEKNSGDLDVKIKEIEYTFEEEKRQLSEDFSELVNKADLESKAKSKQLNECNDKYKREVKRLDDKLKLEQKKFAEEKSQLLKDMTESYEKAASETEVRYNQMTEERENNLKTIKKLEHHLESMQVKFHEEMLKQVEQHEKERKNMEHKLSELSVKLKEKQNSSSFISNEEKDSLNRMIDDLQSALHNAKEVIKEKSSCIHEYKSELSTLRDCVRRECEERYELTEALAQARTELLSHQRFNNIDNSSKQLRSHPLVYNRKVASGSKLTEISQSHEKFVKLEKISKSAGNIDESKDNFNMLSGSGRKPVKSQNSDCSSTSKYSKSKLRISLKN